MKLPRRVPWLSLQELDQVCAWIYTDENDIDAKIKAVNRASIKPSVKALLMLISEVSGMEKHHIATTCT